MLANSLTHCKNYLLFDVILQKLKQIFPLNKLIKDLMKKYPADCKQKSLYLKNSEMSNRNFIQFTDILTNSEKGLKNEK